jgi:hypothetical protein
MSALVGGVAVLAAVLAGLIGANRRDVPTHPEARPAIRLSPSATSPLPATPPADPGQLATDLNQAQTVIDDPASSSAQLASTGWFEQLATLALERGRASARQTTLSALDDQAGATMRADLAAGVALAGLVTPRKSLPHWKILAPQSPATLIGYFRAAQARFGVGWQYLAAIEFIETKFGRVDGLSTAGAEGPMQFLPTTWARYGTGDVHNPRDAIFGAARYLVANGAPGDIAGALYRYNPSADYVNAVEDYAAVMRDDPRAFFGYYEWQVIYALLRRPVVLPVGYPRVRPVPVPPSSPSVALSGVPPK